MNESSPLPHRPLISILITTFNRKELLKRCIDRVLVQTFKDFELIIIDDCSTDGTDALIRSYSDPRIIHIRNEENVGAKLGDRAHIKRFVYELSRGDYFVYVCDDDYWISSQLLEKQAEYIKKYPKATMITGSQLSCFLNDGESSPAIDENNLHEYVDEHLNTRDPRLHLFKNLFPSTVMSSDAFLEYFAKRPVESNILGGATLYNRELFMLSGTLQSMEGSKWQAGYELRFGPAAYGDCIYINEPCLLGELRQHNASFTRTQLEHYLDCIVSINKSLEKPISDWKYATRKTFLQSVRKQAIANVGKSYLRNTIYLKRHGNLTMCTEENISVPVTAWHIVKTRVVNGIGFSIKDLILMFLTLLPGRYLRRIDALMLNYPRLRNAMGAP